MAEREEFDMSGMDGDAMAEKVVSELLVCENCGTQADGADSLNREITDDGLVIGLTFNCENCGTFNDNKAVLS